MHEVVQTWGEWTIWTARIVVRAEKVFALAITSKTAAMACEKRSLFPAAFGMIRMIEPIGMFVPLKLVMAVEKAVEDDILNLKWQVANAAHFGELPREKR